MTHDEIIWFFVILCSVTLININDNCFIESLDLLNKSRIGIKLRFRIRNEVWPQHSSWHIPKLNHSTIYHFFTFYVFLFVLTCVAVIGNNCTCKSFEACFIISIYYIKRSSDSSKVFWPYQERNSGNITSFHYTLEWYIFAWRI